MRRLSDTQVIPGHSPDITDLPGKRRLLSKLLRYAVLASILLFLIFGGISYFNKSIRTVPEANYRTSSVEYGGISQTVTANGSLNPVALVSIGTQISGTVQKLYADFNDHVTAGQVLAQLDPSLLQAQLDQDLGALRDAQSSLDLAAANEARMRPLAKLEYITRQEYDTTLQAFRSAQAKVAAAQAVIHRDKVNLDNTIIRSPVSGVVVSRDVDVGQTVAASFQTPTLFKIAKDLRDMQIDTNVAEADVGRVRVGQPVSFTVDAFTGRAFKGTVRQIRLNATTQQNVVTYDVVIKVNNGDLSLLPAMTAYINIITNERSHALLIPNAALRFKPHAFKKPPADAGADAAPVSSPKPFRQADTPTAIVYVLRAQHIAPVPLRTGISDNRMTEVLDGDLKAGDRLVVEEMPADKAHAVNATLLGRIFR